MVKHTQTIRRQIAKLQFKLQIAIRRQSVKKSANVKIFILFTWFFDIILLSKQFFRKKMILGLEGPFQKLVSDICRTSDILTDG